MTNLNVLIPMAGAGTRFAEAGYDLPKPLVDVNGMPMIEAVVKNIGLNGKYTFIVQKSHYEAYGLQQRLSAIADNPNIVIVDGVTEGAAVTALLASHFIDNENPLLIVNSDQIVEWDPESFMYKMVSEDADGGIVTFTNDHPKWSYAKVSNGVVSGVAEKLPISNRATVGIYYWKHGSSFVKFAKAMIDKNIRTNNEFYICPVYNEAISANQLIVEYPVLKMWGIGTPEDLTLYLGRTND